jgi:hypothetical protein
MVEIKVLDADVIAPGDFWIGKHNQGHTSFLLAQGNDFLGRLKPGAARRPVWIG